jgi:hypothetical protein
VIGSELDRCRGRGQKWGRLYGRPAKQRQPREAEFDNAFTSTVELSMNPSPAAYAMYGPRCCCCDRIPDIIFPTNKPVGWSFSILPCGGHHIMGVGLDW